MRPIVLWLCLLGLAAPALVAWLTVALKLTLNTRLFLQACVRLLERRDHARLEKLLGTVPHASTAVLLQAMWQERNAADDVGERPPVGYRQKTEVEPYEERLRRAVSPALARLRARWGRLAAASVPGLLSPLIVGLAAHEPGMAAWLVAAGSALVSLHTLYWTLHGLPRDADQLLTTMAPWIESALE